MSTAGRENRPVVVGVDGTDASLRALEWAIEEAQLRGCAVHAVTVWSVDPARDIAGTSPAEARETHQQQLTRSVAKVIDGRTGLPQILPRLIESTPTAGLVEAAEGAALLVLASHGGERLRKFFVGSVSAGCARHATVPVVLVPPA
ncbi:universal stress protein [Qaidamihabitans albus]|uniref:universal stress protein n=1 Tax=Qaidamihabitans albus TaxID=2795733 RepID=UPI0018F23AC9|nr:universal stress protein [Qaidamihabitans albus]